MYICAIINIDINVLFLGGKFMEVLFQNATDVRKNWSETLEEAVREKPVFLKRVRDHLVLIDTEMFSELIPAKLNVILSKEDDNSITAEFEELDLLENAEDSEIAINNLIKSLIEYSKDYYNELSYWHTASNRKTHFQYVIKALLLNDIGKIRENMILVKEG